MKVYLTKNEFKGNDDYSKQFYETKVGALSPYIEGILFLLLVVLMVRKHFPK